MTFPPKKAAYIVQAWTGHLPNRCFVAAWNCLIIRAPPSLAQGGLFLLLRLTLILAPARKQRIQGRQFLAVAIDGESLHRFYHLVGRFDEFRFIIELQLGF